MPARSGPNVRFGGARRLAAATLEWTWRSVNALSIALYPVSLLYRALVATRRAAYRHGILRREFAACPVVVVGNITVGGNGKTPFTAWLARWLAERGFKPGIVLRGYRGESDRWPLAVTADTPPRLAGDEAVLLARLTALPVVAGPDRAADCRLLLQQHDCNVIVSDDGLQHLALHRDFEIALDDPVSGHGNGWCLPAGPLREPATRLAAVDLVVRYADAQQGVVPHSGLVRRLDNTGETQPLEDFSALRLLALTAIARPERFFDTLSAHGLAFDRRALPDHHHFQARDIPETAYDAILVTEKDAVKLTANADRRIRVVALELEVSPAVTEHLERTLLPKLIP